MKWPNICIWLRFVYFYNCKWLCFGCRRLVTEKITGKFSRQYLSIIKYMRVWLFPETTYNKYHSHWILLKFLFYLLWIVWLYNKIFITIVMIEAKTNEKRTHTQTNNLSSFVRGDFFLPRIIWGKWKAKFVM